MQNVDQKDYRHKNVYCFALPPDFKLRDLIYDNIRHWRVNPQELLGEKYKLVGLTVDPKQSANLRDPQGNLLTKGMIDEINASNPSLYPEVQRVTIDGEVVRATARDSSAVAAKPPPLLAGRAVSNAETSAVGTGDKDKAQAKARDVTCIYDPPDSLELVVLKDKTRFCRGKVFCKVGEQKIEDRAFCEQLAHLPRDVCPSATDCAYAEAVRDRQGRPVADEVLESAPKHTNARPDSGNGRGNGVNGGTGTGISN